MCGRYGAPRDLEVYAAFLPVTSPLQAIDLQLEYSIGQLAPVFAINRDGQVAVQMMRMGLIPHSWTGHVKDWSCSTHNARLETIDGNKSFARAWSRGRRCIVPAAWVSERLGVVDAPGGKLQADFHDRDGRPLGLAALWDYANTADGQVLSFALITRQPGPRMAPFHPREVCVLPSETWKSYLVNVADVDLAQPWPDDAWKMTLPPVSRKRIAETPADLFAPQNAA